MTTSQRRYSFEVTVAHDLRTLDVDTRKITLKFNGASTTIDILGGTSAATAALRRLRGFTIDKIWTNADDIAAAGALSIGVSFRIAATVLSWDLAETNIWSHDGSPPSSSFFCDTTATLFGVTASAPVGTLPAKYDVRIGDDGATWQWRIHSGETAVEADYSASLPMLALTTTLLAQLPNGARLSFDPPSGRAAGEILSVVITGTVGQTGAVIPATFCITSLLDTSLTAGGVYTGDRAIGLTVAIVDAPIIAGYPVEGAWAWKTSESGAAWSDPIAIIALQPLPLFLGTTVTFASARGHTIGASWELAASTPSIKVDAGRKATLDVRGTADTAAAYYRIISGAPHFGRSTFYYSLSTDAVPDAAPVGTMYECDTSGVYLPGPPDAAATAAGIDATATNGITALFSASLGYPAGYEWVVFAGAGGATTTVAEPTAPLLIETTAGTRSGGYYIITITSAGDAATSQAATFTYSMSTSASVPPSEISATPVEITDWWVGNPLISNGLRLRFAQKWGFDIGTAWQVEVNVGASSATTVSVVSAPQSRLRAAVSGASTSARFWVRVNGAKTGPTGKDVYVISYDGSDFGGGGEIRPSTDVAGNTEVGNGVSLYFGSPTGAGFAPGQLWEVTVFAQGASMIRVPSLVEYAPCSGRGVCALETGYCTCAPGFTGVDCSVRTDEIIVSSGEPGFTVHVSDPVFTGDVLRLESDKAASPDFYFIEAVAAGQRVFGVRGDGTLAVQLFEVSSLIVTDGALIQDGGLTLDLVGLTVNHGGIDVLDGGARLAGSVVSAPTLDVLVQTQVPQGYTSSAVRVEIRTLDTAPHDSTLLELRTSQYITSDAGATVGTTDSLDVFTVKASGRTHVHSGGFVVSNPVPYNTSGPDAARTEGGDSFGGAIISGGLAVRDYGVDVLNGGLRVTNDPRGTNGVWPNNSDVSSTLPVLAAIAMDANFSGSVLVGGYNGLADVTDGYALLELHNSGIDVLRVGGSGFTEIYSGGLQVDAGGVAVLAGGLSVISGGTVIESGGLSVLAGGAQVVSGGAVVSINGVDAGGVSIVQSGAGVVYTSSMLELSADVASSADFNFVRMQAAGLTYFRVDGRGDMYLGSTPGGDPLMRIAANGFIQTLQHEDISMISDEGQTIFVSAGDGYASASGGVVGSLIMRAGNGIDTIRGGDISLAAGRADLSPGGHATLRGGDVLSSGYQAGDISLYPGQGLQDEDAGTLRLLDGRAGARGTVLEARPTYTLLTSGGTVSLSSGTTPGANLELSAYIDANLIAGSNVLLRAGQLVSLGGVSSVVATAPIVHLEAGTALEGMAPLVSFVATSTFYGGADTIVLLSNEVTVSATNTIQMASNSASVITDSLLTLSSGGSLYATSTDFVEVSSMAVRVLASDTLTLAGSNGAFLYSDYGVSLLSGTALLAAAEDVVSLVGGNRVMLTTGDAVISASNTVSISGATSLVLIASDGPLVASSATDNMFLSAAGPLFSLSAANVFAAVATESVLLSADSLSLGAANNLIVRSDAIASLSAPDVLVHAGQMSVFSGGDAKMFARGEFALSANGQVGVNAGTGLSLSGATVNVVSTSATTLSAGTLLTLTAPTKIAATSGEIALSTSGNLYAVSSGHMSLMSEDALLTASNTVVSISSSNGMIDVSAGQSLRLFGAQSVSLRSPQEVVVGAGGSLSLFSDGYTVMSPATSLSLLPGADLIAMSPNINLIASEIIDLSAPSLLAAGNFLSLTGADSFMLDTGGLFSVSSQSLYLRAWQAASLYGTSQVDIATAGQATLRGTSGTSIYSGSKAILYSNGVLSLRSAANDVIIDAPLGGISLTANNAMTMTSGNVLSLSAQGNLYAASEGGALSLYGAQSLSVVSGKNAFIQALGDISIASSTGNLWMQSQGTASLTAVGNVIVRTGTGTLSLYAQGALVGETAGILSLSAPLDTAVVSSGTVLSLVGGNTVVATAVGMVVNSADTVSLHGSTSVVTKSAAIVASANDVLSLYGTNSAYLNSQGLLTVASSDGNVIVSAATGTLSTFGSQSLLSTTIGDSIAWAGGSTSIFAQSNIDLSAQSGTLTAFAGSYIAATASSIYASATIGDMSLYAAANTYVNTGDRLSLVAVSDIDILTGGDAVMSAPTGTILMSSRDKFTAVSAAVLLESTGIVSLVAADSVLLDALTGSLSFNAEMNNILLYAGQSISTYAVAGDINTVTAVGNIGSTSSGLTSIYATTNLLLSALEGITVQSAIVSFVSDTMFSRTSASTSIVADVNVVTKAGGEIAMAAPTISLHGYTNVIAEAYAVSLTGEVINIQSNNFLIVQSANALSLSAQTINVDAGDVLAVTANNVASFYSTAISLHSSAQTDLRSQTIVIAAAPTVSTYSTTVTHIVSSGDVDVRAENNALLSANTLLSVYGQTVSLTSADSTLHASNEMILSGDNSLRVMSNLGNVYIAAPLESVLISSGNDVEMIANAAVLTTAPLISAYGSNSINLLAKDALYLESNADVFINAGLKIALTAADVLTADAGSALSLTAGTILDASGGEAITLGATSWAHMIATQGGVSIGGAASLMAGTPSFSSITAGTSLFIGSKAGPTSLYSQDDSLYMTGAQSVFVASQNDALYLSGTTAVQMASPAHVFVTAGATLSLVGATGGYFEGTIGASISGGSGYLALSSDDDLSLTSTYSDIVLTSNNGNVALSTPNTGIISLAADGAIELTSNQDITLIANDYVSFFGANSFIISTNGPLSFATLDALVVEGKTVSAYGSASLMVSTPTLLVNGDAIIDVRSSGSVYVSTPYLTAQTELLSNYQSGSLFLVAAPVTSVYGSSSLAVAAPYVSVMASCELRLESESFASMAARDGGLSLYGANALNFAGITMNTPHAIIETAAVFASIYGHYSLMLKASAGPAVVDSDVYAAVTSATLTSIYGASSLLLQSPALAVLSSQAAVSVYSDLNVAVTALSTLALSGLNQASLESSNGPILVSANQILSLISTDNALTVQAPVGSVSLIAGTTLDLYGDTNVVIESGGELSFGAVASVLSEAPLITTSTTASLLLHSDDYTKVSATESLEILSGNRLSLYAATETFVMGTSFTARAANFIQLDSSNALYINSGVGGISLVAQGPLTQQGDSVSVYSTTDVLIDAFSGGISITAAENVLLMSNRVLSLYAPTVATLESNGAVNILAGSGDLTLSTATGAAALLSQASTVISTYGGLSLTSGDSLLVTSGVSLTLSSASTLSVMSHASGGFFTAQDMGIQAEGSMSLTTGASRPFSLSSGGLANILSNDNMLVSSQSGSLSLQGYTSLSAVSSLGPVSIAALADSAGLYAAQNLILQSQSGSASLTASLTYVDVSAVTSVSIHSNDIRLDSSSTGTTAITGQVLLADMGQAVSLSSSDGIFMAASGASGITLNAVGVGGDLNLLTSSNMLVSASNQMLFSAQTASLTTATLSASASEELFITGTNLVSIHSANAIGAVSGGSLSLTAANTDIMSAEGGSIFMATPALDGLISFFADQITETAINFVSLYGAQSVIVQGANAVVLTSENIIDFASSRSILLAAGDALNPSGHGILAMDDGSISMYAGASLTASTDALLSLHVTSGSLLASAAYVSLSSVDGMNVYASGTGTFEAASTLNLRSGDTVSLSATSQTVITAGTDAIVAASGTASIFGAGSLYLVTQNQLITTGDVISTTAATSFILAAPTIVAASDSFLSSSTDVTSLFSAGGFSLSSATELVASGTNALSLTSANMLTAASENILIAQGLFTSFYGTESLMATSDDVLALQSNTMLLSSKSISAYGLYSAIISTDGLVSVSAGDSIAVNAAQSLYMVAGGLVSLSAINVLAQSGAALSLAAGSDADITAVATVSINAGTNANVAAPDIGVAATGGIILASPNIDLTSTANVRLTSPLIQLAATTFELNALSSASIYGGQSLFVLTQGIASIEGIAGITASTSGPLLLQSANAISLIAATSLTATANDVITTGTIHLSLLAGSGSTDSQLLIEANGVLELKGTYVSINSATNLDMSTVDNLNVYANGPLSLASNSDATLTSSGSLSLVAGSDSNDALLLQASTGTLSLIAQSAGVALSAGAEFIAAAATSMRMAAFQGAVTIEAAQSFVDITAATSIQLLATNAPIIMSADFVSTYGTSSLALTSSGSLILSTNNDVLVDAPSGAIMLGAATSLIAHPQFTSLAAFQSLFLYADNAVLVQGDGFVSVTSASSITAAAPLLVMNAGLSFVATGNELAHVTSPNAVVIDSLGVVSLQGFSSLVASTTNGALLLSGYTSVLASSAIYAQVSAPVVTVLATSGALSLSSATSDATLWSAESVSVLASAGAVVVESGANAIFSAGEHAYITAVGSLSAMAESSVFIRANSGVVSINAVGNSVILQSSTDTVSLFGSTAVDVVSSGDVRFDAQETLSLFGGNNVLAVSPQLSLYGTTSMFLLAPSIGMEGDLVSVHASTSIQLSSDGSISFLANTMIDSAAARISSSATDSISLVSGSAVHIIADGVAELTSGVTLSLTSGTIETRASNFLDMRSNGFVSFTTLNSLYMGSDDGLLTVSGGNGIDIAAHGGGGLSLSTEGNGNLQMAAGGHMSLFAVDSLALFSPTTSLFSTTALQARSSNALEFTGGATFSLAAPVGYIESTTSLDITSPTLSSTSNDYKVSGDTSLVIQGNAGATVVTRTGSLSLAAIDLGADIYVLSKSSVASVYGYSQTVVSSQGTVSLLGAGGIDLYSYGNVGLTSEAVLSLRGASSLLLASSNADAVLSAEGGSLTLSGTSGVTLSSNSGGVSIFAASTVSTYAGVSADITANHLLTLNSDTVSLAASALQLQGVVSLVGAAPFVGLTATDQINLFSGGNTVISTTASLSMVASTSMMASSTSDMALNSATSLSAVAPVIGVTASQTLYMTGGAALVASSPYTSLTASVGILELAGSSGATLTAGAGLLSLISPTTGVLIETSAAVSLMGSNSILASSNAYVEIVAPLTSIQGTSSLLLNSNGPLLMTAVDTLSLWGTTQVIAGTVGPVSLVSQQSNVMIQSQGGVTSIAGTSGLQLTSGQNAALIAVNDVSVYSAATTEIVAVGTMSLSAGGILRVDSAQEVDIVTSGTASIYSATAFIATAPFTSILGDTLVDLVAPTLFLDGTVVTSVLGVSSLVLESNGLATLSAPSVSIYGGLANGVIIQSPTGISLVSTELAPVYLSGRGGISLTTESMLSTKATDFLTSASLISLTANSRLDLTSNDVLYLGAATSVSIAGAASLLLSSNLGPVSLSAQENLYLTANTGLVSMTAGDSIQIAATTTLLATATTALSVTSSTLQFLASSQAALSVASGRLSMGATNIDINAEINGEGTITIKAPEAITHDANILVLTAVNSLGLYSTAGPASLIASTDLELLSTGGSIDIVSAAVISIAAPLVVATAPIISLFASTNLIARSTGAVSLGSTSSTLTLTAPLNIDIASSSGAVNVQGTQSILLSSAGPMQLLASDMELYSQSTLSLTAVSNAVITSDNYLEIKSGTISLAGASSFVLTAMEMALMRSNDVTSISAATSLMAGAPYMELYGTENVFVTAGSGLLTLSSPNNVVVSGTNGLALSSAASTSLTGSAGLEVSTPAGALVYAGTVLSLVGLNSAHLLATASIDIVSSQSVLVHASSDTGIVTLKGGAAAGGVLTATADNVLIQGSSALSVHGEMGLELVSGAANILLQSAGALAATAITSLLLAAPVVSLYSDDSTILRTDGKLSLYGANSIVLATLGQISLYSADDGIVLNSANGAEMAAAENLYIHSTDGEVDMRAATSLNLRSNDMVIMRAANGLISLSSGLSLLGTSSLMAQSPLIDVFAGQTLSLTSGGPVLLASQTDAVQITTPTTVSVMGSLGVTVASNAAVSLSAMTQFLVDSAGTISLNGHMGLIAHSGNMQVLEAEGIQSLYSGTALYGVSGGPLVLTAATDSPLSLYGDPLYLASKTFVSLTADVIGTAATSAVSLYSGSRVDLTANDALTLNAPAVSVVGTTGLTLESQYGDLSLFSTRGANIIAMAASHYEAYAAGHVSLAAGTLIDIQAQTSVSIAAGTQGSNSGDLDLTASSGIYAVASGEVSIYSSTRAVFSTSGPLSIASSSSVFVEAGGDLNLKGTSTANLLAPAVTISATSTTLSLASASNLIAVGTDIDITSSGVLSLNAGTAATLVSGGSMSLLPGEDLLLASETGQISMYSSKDMGLLTDGNMILKSSSLSLLSDSQFLAFAPDAVSLVSNTAELVASAATSLTLTANTVLSGSAASIFMSAENVLSLQAANGLVFIDGDTVIASADSLSFYGLNDLPINSGGNIALSPAQALLLSGPSSVYVSSPVLITMDTPVFSLNPSASLILSSVDIVSLSAIFDLIVDAGQTVSLSGSLSLALSAPQTSLNAADIGLTASATVSLFANNALAFASNDAMMLTVADAGSLSMYGGSSLVAQSNGAALLSSASFTSVFGENSLVLATNGATDISAPFLNLYGTNSIALTSDGVVSVASANGDVLISSPNGIVSLYGGLSLEFVSPTLLLAADILSLNGANSMVLNTPAALQLLSSTVVSVAGTTSISVTSASGPVIIGAPSGLLDISGATMASLYSPNSVVVTAPFISAVATDQVSLYGGNSVTLSGFAAVLQSSATLISAFSGAAMSYHSSGELDLYSDANVIATAMSGLRLSAGGATGIELTASSGSIATNANYISMLSNTDVDIIAYSALSLSSQTSNLFLQTYAAGGGPAGLISAYASGGLFLQSAQSLVGNAPFVSFGGANSLVLNAEAGTLLLNANVGDVSLSSATTVHIVSNGLAAIDDTTLIRLRSAGQLSMWGANTVYQESGGSASFIAGNLAVIQGASSLLMSTGTGAAILSSAAQVSLTATTTLGLDAENIVLTAAPGLSATGGGLVATAATDISLYAGGNQHITAGSEVLVSGPLLVSLSSGIEMDLISPIIEINAISSTSLYTGKLDTTILTDLGLTVGGATLLTTGSSLSLTATSALALKTTSGPVTISAVATDGTGDMALYSTEDFSLLAEGDASVTSNGFLTLSSDGLQITTTADLRTTVTGSVLTSSIGSQSLVSTGGSIIQQALAVQTVATSGDILTTASCGLILTASGGPIIATAPSTISLYAPATLALAAGSDGMLAGGGKYVSLSGSSAVSLSSTSLIDLVSNDMIHTTALGSLSTYAATSIALRVDSLGVIEIVSPNGFTSVMGGGGVVVGSNSQTSIFGQMSLQLWSNDVIDVRGINSISIEGNNFIDINANIISIVGANTLSAAASNLIDIVSSDTLSFYGAKSFLAISDGILSLTAASNLVLSAPIVSTYASAEMDLVANGLLGLRANEVTMAATVSIDQVAPEMLFAASDLLSLYGMNSFMATTDGITSLGAASLFAETPAGGAGVIQLKAYDVLVGATNMFSAISSTISIVANGESGVLLTAINGPIAAVSSDYVSLYGHNTVIANANVVSLLALSGDIDLIANGAILASSTGMTSLYAAGLEIITANDALSLYGQNSLTLVSSNGQAIIASPVAVSIYGADMNMVVADGRTMSLYGGGTLIGVATDSVSFYGGNAFTAKTTGTLEVSTAFRLP